MMSINNVVSLVGSITNTVNEIKTLYATIPIKFFLPPNRKKLIELQEKISTLENQINIGFPKLAQLIQTYSNLIADVRIAGALSDKIAELYEMAPGLERLTQMFANERQMNYSQIASNINQLPELDISERGKLEAKLSMIRDLIRDLKNLNQDDISTAKRIFANISTQYSDIESTLSALLKKILTNFENLQ